MVKTEIGQVKDKKLTFCQCQSVEEAQKEGLPTGCYWYWDHGGKRITEPGKIIEMIISDSEAGNLDIASLTDPNKMQDHYDRLRKAQIGMIQEHVNRMRDSLTKDPNLTKDQKAEIEKHYKTLQDNLEQPESFPGMDGFATGDHIKKMQELYDSNPHVANFGKMPNNIFQ